MNYNQKFLLIRDLDSNSQVLEIDTGIIDH